MEIGHWRCYDASNRMKQSESLIYELRQLLAEFESIPVDQGIRSRVLGLVPAFEVLRDLGKSLIPNGTALGARDRLLTYFLTYPRTVLDEKELALVAGISEWGRRIRELRVQFGWKIATGATVLQMDAEQELSLDDLGVDTLSPNQYVLLDSEQDREAAFRWNVANSIRKRPGGGKSRILAYLRTNVGKPVTGEELSYVAHSSEWARRTRELRTEDGWPISTKMSGNPTLPTGVYVLETDRQSPPHDRRIDEYVRRKVLRRDAYRCRICGWSHQEWNPADPRFLELHHQTHHAQGGRNDPTNLLTVCNVCHDEVHKRRV